MVSFLTERNIKCETSTPGSYIAKRDKLRAGEDVDEQDDTAELDEMLAGAGILK